VCSACPTDAPKPGLYALSISCLEVRRLSHSAKKYRVSATGNLRDDLPQSHRRGVNDFQAAILLGEELALQNFSCWVEVCSILDAGALQRKVEALFSLCISVGALLYNGESFQESQTTNASRSATVARRVLSNLKDFSDAEIRHEEDEDRVAQLKLPYQKELAFSNAVSELDTVIAALAACSFDLQMVKIMRIVAH
jgi:hypothetical protein